MRDRCDAIYNNKMSLPTRLIISKILIRNRCKMLKIYKEHPEFDEFTKFDTTTGKLETITSQEFYNFIPRDLNIADHNDIIKKIEYNGNSIFLGEISETYVRFPRRIYFQITRNCNLFCDYCFIKSKPGEPHVPKQAIFEIAEFMGMIHEKITWVYISIPFDQ